MRRRSRHRLGLRPSITHAVIERWQLLLPRLLRQLALVIRELLQLLFDSSEPRANVANKREFGAIGRSNCT